jgi:hypothetical protein
MTSKLRPALAWAICIGFGLVCTLELRDLLNAPPPSAEPRMVTRVKISARFQAPVLAAATPTITLTTATTTVLPLRGELATPRKTLPTPTLKVDPAEVALVGTLAGPASTPPPLSSPPTLPVIVTLEAPPVPPLDPDPLSAPPADTPVPGGNTLVLGMLLDENGTVINAKVLVRSNEPLTDITLAMGYMGLRWTDFSPPMAPGERRWIEHRIDFGPSSAVFTPLP